MADQVVIVTGAGNGIGLSMIQLLMKSAKVSHVVAVDLNIDKLKAIQKEHPEKVSLVTGDVSKTSTSIEAVETAVKQGGHLNSLILNAAMVRPTGYLPKLVVNDWRKAFDVNFFSQLDMMQQAWPHLLESEGNVMMTSTRVSQEPTDSWTCYATTKAALNYLCSCLPLEEPKIKYVAITPGAVDTDSQTASRLDGKIKNFSPKMRKFLNEIYSSNKLLKPEQPASAFVKLVETGIPDKFTGKTIYWGDI
ncbi:hypothetical protein PV08_00011 [Exophiala spinifera]|uniref:NAD(P)-binding protein n=1 Tax=Exophiala spinifera TaxID=91928 RepID=A0A0D2C7A5_9EURO|nr:uncharacterized protein PV08_00011 [Exophiala spinifera]KIW19439.1 hypothetical protein PV08_00011 [Exophiala spinifera]